MTADTIPTPLSLVSSPASPVVFQNSCYPRFYPVYPVPPLSPHAPCPCPPCCPAAQTVHHRITSTSLVCSIPHLTDPWPPIPTASVQPTHTFSPLTPSLPHSLRCSYCTPFYSCCLCTQTILFPNYNTLRAPTAWTAMISSSPSWPGVLHSPSDSILSSMLFPSTESTQ